MAIEGNKVAVNLNKDTVYRAAKPKDKDYTISDGGGLFLFVGVTGSKLWRFVYAFHGKRRKIAFGAYPDTSLENARRKAKEAREQIADGKDPGGIRKEAKAAKQRAKANDERISEGLPILNSFADITRQWLNSIAHLTSTTTHTKKTSRIERLAFPWLGDKPITEIKSADVLAVLKSLIDKQQLETAHRLHGEISSIFAYAIGHNFIRYSHPIASRHPRREKHRCRFITFKYRINRYDYPNPGPMRQKSGYRCRNPFCHHPRLF